MIAALAAAAGVVWFLALALVVGGLALRSDPLAADGACEEPPARGALLAAATLALAAGAVALAAKVLELTGRLDADGLARVALATRYGRVWCAEEVAVLTAMALLAMAWLARRSPAAAVVPAAAALLARPFASHSAAGDNGLVLVVVHGVHLLAMALWLGGLMTLVLRFAAVGGDATARRRAARLLVTFSSRAPLWVGVLAASGLWIARVHTGSWPALLGTAYGAWLLAKIALFASALAVAAVLRARVVPAWAALASAESNGPGPVAATRLRLGAELALGTAALAAAVMLAQSIPGAHDVVAWWLPFRFSIRATWQLPTVPARALCGLAVLVVASVAGARAALRRDPRRAAMTATAGLAAASALALPALAVPAFPGTYWRSEVPYDAASVAHGRELFVAHCTVCHGEAGRGDGPQARSLPKPPADLTQPHTADHTAGDMFWWLTHGIPASGMPGFEGTLGGDDRWDLINYLRALADGYQARLLSTRIAPRLPWIGGIDFDFTTLDGRHGLLRDYRGRSSVVIVLFTRGASQARLATLRRVLPQIREHGGEVLAVPADQAPGDMLAALTPLPVIVDEAEQIVSAYRLFRRTFESPGNERDDDPVPHLELLIDRFGYLRARWRPDVQPEGWNDPGLLLGELDELAAEPQIRPPPDDHVH